MNVYRIIKKVNVSTNPKEELWASTTTNVLAPDLIEALRKTASTPGLLHGATCIVEGVII